jgi:putative transposase
MHLSPFGEVVASTWYWIGGHFAGVELDECAIMPDHLHGILILTPPVTLGVEASARAVARRKPLGGIIGAFKTRSTAEVNRLRGTPGRPFWQRDFWDRVIREVAELERIREYIRRNPASYRPRTFHV